MAYKSLFRDYFTSFILHSWEYDQNTFDLNELGQAFIEFRGTEEYTALCIEFPEYENNYGWHLVMCDANNPDRLTELLKAFPSIYEASDEWPSVL